MGETEPAIWSLTATGGAPAGTQPQPRAERVSAVIDGRVHDVGGRGLAGDADAARPDHADVTSHRVWDAAPGSWDEAAPASVARSSAAGRVIDGLLCAAGGREEFEPTRLTEVQDPAEDRWRELAPVPRAQAGSPARSMTAGSMSSAARPRSPTTESSRGAGSTTPRRMAVPPCPTCPPRATASAP